MRKVIEEQMQIGQKDIGSIELDLNSRDEIPKLLMGLQYIYTTNELRTSVFNLLSTLTPPAINPDKGRRGMDYWKILVLGTLRLCCNWDYDKLKQIADNHYTVRLMLGHSEFNFEERYPLQTLKDNVCLLTPEVLNDINRCVVNYSRKLLVKGEQDTFHARCDSFVLETNVHYPTDINLLLDAMRKVISLIAVACAKQRIPDWRQSEHNSRKLKKLYQKAQRLKRSTSKNPEKKHKREQHIKDAHTAYLNMAASFLDKAKVTIEKLRSTSLSEMLRILEIEKYMDHAYRQIDQIHRRIIMGEQIPHDEKVFSIFEEHTEWISKGKAGVPQELGLKVCIIEDQYGFIINHRVMQNQSDDQVCVPIIKETKEHFPNLIGCSFDKGFYSPENVNKLKPILQNVVLPKKGKLSRCEKETQLTDEFIQARKQHSAVESAINALENHGLDRCPDRGLDAFMRYTSLAMLARNIQILGNILQQKELKREQRRKKYNDSLEKKRKAA